MGKAPDHAVEATTLPNMKRVLVFCGSSPGGRPEYAQCAGDLGRMLASRGLEVVYGGARVGLMGALADAALDAGGKVIGVIPNRLVEAEIAHAGVTKLHVVDTMHERKALMAELSDAVIALPGGTGTLDELFEMFTWSQLGLHRKPIGLLDVESYWAPLLVFMDHMVQERFIYAEHRNALLVEHDAATLLERLQSFEHHARDKWLDRDQSVPNTRSPASPSPGRM
jgi:uncharacterized protein (TIGR00730 family)